MKDGTTADGLDQMEYGYVNLPTGDEYDLIGATPNANKANKLYLKNHSIDETLFISIRIHGQAVGRLYGGDWMFIPADFHDGDADIQLTANGGTNKLCYALFHEGTTLVTT
tara:strand:+ start:39 stop:371 length:333 start_codon:yes stop_codon:yes gene_type:complete